MNTISNNIGGCVLDCLRNNVGYPLWKNVATDPKDPIKNVVYDSVRNYIWRTVCFSMQPLVELKLREYDFK